MKKNTTTNEVLTNSEEAILKRRWTLRIVLFIFGLIGFGVSLFLTYEYSIDETIPCGGISIGGENSCQSVKDSIYAKMIGIDVPVWGAIFFTMMLTFLFVYIIKVVDTKKEKVFNNLFFALVTFGAIFETVLTLIAIFIIKAVCIWCLLTELIVVTIFLITLLERIFSSRNKTSNI